MNRLHANNSNDQEPTQAIWVGSCCRFTKDLCLRYAFVGIAALLVTCSGCGRGDKQSYFLTNGEYCREQLISELSEVQSLQDLFEKQEELTLLFDRIAQLGIEARAYQIRTKTDWGVPEEFEVRNQELKKQMLRVLKIPGTRAFLEKCQAPAFEKLYAFEMRNSKDVHVATLSR